MPAEGRGPDLRQASKVTRPRRLADGPSTPLERVRKWLLLGSRVVVNSSRNQAGGKPPEQGFAKSARVVHEQEEAEVERWPFQREAPVRAEPGAWQRPEALHRAPSTWLLTGLRAAAEPGRRAG